MPDAGMSLSGNYLQRIPGGADLATTQNTLNEVISRLNDMLETQVFSDGTTKRMIIGYQLNGWGSGKSFGIKISIEGKDVTKAADSELLFSLSVDAWTWRNNAGQITKQFQAQTGTESYYDPTGRNYVNVGDRPSTNTYGFEMAKPGVDLNNDPI